eukprot:s3838_g8.t1
MALTALRAYKMPCAARVWGLGLRACTNLACRDAAWYSSCATCSDVSYAQLCLPHLLNAALMPSGHRDLRGFECCVLCSYLPSVHHPAHLSQLVARKHYGTTLSKVPLSCTHLKDSRRSESAVVNIFLEYDVWGQGGGAFAS